MDERPEQRPEGELISAALKRSGLSQRQAATRAGISENRWRAIMHGYQNVSAGVNAAVRGPAETVARMAIVVGLAADDFDGVRDDVAEILRAEATATPSAQTESEDDLLRFGREMIEQGKRLEELGWRILGKAPEETDEDDNVAG